MRCSLPTLIALPLTVLLAACADEPGNSDDDTGDVDQPQLADDLGEALDAEATDDFDPTTASLDVAAALAQVLQTDGLDTFTKDGVLDDRRDMAPIGVGDGSEGSEDAIITRRDGCTDLELDDGTLVLDLSDCDNFDGTVSLSWTEDNPIELTFDDAFAVRGKDLDGTVTLTAALVDLTFTVSGALTYEVTHEVAMDTTVALDGGVIVYGSADIATEIEGQALTADATYGTESEPLTYGAGCLCPTSGTVSSGVTAPIDEITIDLDTFIEPGDGSDDYPEMQLPIAPFDAFLVTGADFVATCGDEVAFTEVSDLEVVVAKADLEVAIDAACDAGEIDEATCALTDIALLFMPDEIDVTIPADMVEDLVTPLVQSATDAVCG